VQLNFGESIADIWKVLTGGKSVYVICELDICDQDKLLIKWKREGIVHLLFGNNTAHVMCVGQAIHLGQAMRLNEEAVSIGLG
jgi:hypothetical protein